jgi:hypothetical protein
MVSENQLKAAYLIHISEFTTWPDEKMQLPNFVICLTSGSKLSQPLEELRGQTLKDKELDILYDVPADKIKTCHVLYVEEGFNEKTFLKSFQKSDAVLTISSDANFIKAGGVIEYYMEANKVKMRVNLKMLEQSKLGISSKILRLMDSQF